MDFSVDPDQLAVLSRGLAAAEAALGEVGVRPAEDLRGLVGAAQVASALHEVAASWSHARGRIHAELDGAARAAAAAAEVYGDVEREVTRAATPAPVRSP